MVRIEERIQVVDSFCKLMTAKLKMEDVERSRKGTHVTELIFPLKSFYQKKHPKDITRAELGYFLSGRSYHVILQDLKDSGTIKEVEVEWDGVVGTIDFIDDEITEIKSTRGTRFYEDIRDVPEHWIEQLGYYVSMVFHDRDIAEGVLVVFFINNTKTPYSKKGIPWLHSWKVYYTDLGERREELRRRRILYDDAMATGRPEILPVCPAWLCKGCVYNGNECPRSSVARG